MKLIHLHGYFLNQIMKSGESHVLRETLREVTGIKDVDTISKYTAKFEDLGFLRKKYNYRNNEGQLTTPVTYHVDIPKSNWVRFKKDLLLEDIPDELKAFLVLLKCLCINNTNIIYYNKTEISRRLNLSPKTVKKYIDLAIKYLKLVEVIISSLSRITTSYWLPHMLKVILD